MTSGCIGLQPDLSLQLLGHLDKAPMGLGLTGEDDLSTTRAQSRHDQACVVMAVDDEFVTGRFAHSMEKSDTCIGCGVGSAT